MRAPARLKLYYSVGTTSFDPATGDIRSAVSTDGLLWEEDSTSIIEPGAIGSLDGLGASKPFIVPIRGGFRMYYVRAS